MNPDSSIMIINFIISLFTVIMVSFQFYPEHIDINFYHIFILTQWCYLALLTHFNLSFFLIQKLPYDHFTEEGKRFIDRASYERSRNIAVTLNEIRRTLLSRTETIEQEEITDAQLEDIQQQENNDAQLDDLQQREIAADAQLEDLQQQEITDAQLEDLQQQEIINDAQLENPQQEEITDAQLEDLQQEEIIDVLLEDLHEQEINDIENLPPKINLKRNQRSCKEQGEIKRKYKKYSGIR